MDNVITCPRATCQKNTFTRVAGSVFGHVIEDWCVCGWSKPRLLAIAGMDRLIKPASASERRGKYQDAEENGRKGGLASAKKYGRIGIAAKIAGTAKPKPKRKPYARKNPRHAREAMGYQHLGALDTFRGSSFMLQSEPISGLTTGLTTDPSCS